MGGAGAAAPKACAFPDFPAKEARPAFQALAPHVEAVMEWREALEPEETAERDTLKCVCDLSGLNTPSICWARMCSARAA
jgi:hypothetical protein